MKTVILVLTLAMTAPAAAQSIFFGPISTNIPKTVIITGPGGQKLGTATISDATTYYRDATSELIGSSSNAADGTRVFYDANGKVISSNPLVK